LFSLYLFSPCCVPSVRLHALRVPLVGGLAGTGRAARGTSPAPSTALSPLGRAVAGRRVRRRVAGRVAGVAGRGLGGGRGRVGGSRRRVSAAAAAAAAGPDSWAGEGEVLVSTVDVEVGIGIGVLVGTRELDHGTRGAASAVLNLDLSARDVVLRLVDVGSVDANVLNTEKILAVRSILRDSGGDPVAAPGAPGVGGEVTSTVADTLLLDLEPVTRAIVGLDVVTGGAGHVHEGRARVLHLGVDTKAEANLRAGVDGQDLSVASLGEGTLVATDIRSIGVRAVTDIRGRVGRELDGVVGDRASEAADVLERGTGNTVADGGIEEVVGRDTLGSQGPENNGRDLHGDRQDVRASADL